MSQIENRGEEEREYLKGSRDIGAETVRVTGNVKIPDGESVEFNLIVFGDLNTGKNVSFLGGLHVEGTLRLGEANSVKGSVHCEGNMMIGAKTSIENAVYCLGVLLVGKGVRAGFGERGGGVVCESEIYVEQEFATGAKLEAERIVTVEKLDDELVAKLEQEVPKPGQRRRESPLISREHLVRDRTRKKQVMWEKTEHKGTAHEVPDEQGLD